MSGDLWAMARNGTTLLPHELQKLAAAYDKMAAAVKRVRALHKPISVYQFVNRCDVCFPNPYPCRTIRALDGDA